MNFYRAFKISDRFGIAFTQENPDAEPVVYFLDLKYDFEDICGIKCQVTSGSYYVSTIKDHKGDLCLDGSIAAWTVPKEAMRVACAMCWEEWNCWNREKFLKSTVA